MRLITSLAAILVAGTAAAQPADTGAVPTAPEPWSVAIAPRVGALLSTSKLGPFVIGGLAIDIPIAAEHRLLIGLDASITRPSHDGTVMDARVPMTGTYTINETELGIAALVSYRFAGADAKLVPWLGAGPLLHLLRSSETTNLAPGTNTAQSTELGVEVGGGADVRMGPGYLAGDLRFTYSKLDHEITGSTNAGHVALGVGYRFIF